MNCSLPVETVQKTMRRYADGPSLLLQLWSILSDFWGRQRKKLIPTTESEVISRGAIKTAFTQLCFSIWKDKEATNQTLDYGALWGVRSSITVVLSVTTLLCYDSSERTFKLRVKKATHVIMIHQEIYPIICPRLLLECHYSFSILCYETKVLYQKLLKEVQKINISYNFGRCFSIKQLEEEFW